MGIWLPRLEALKWLLISLVSLVTTVIVLAIIWPATKDVLIALMAVVVLWHWTVALYHQRDIKVLQLRAGVWERETIYGFKPDRFLRVVKRYSHIGVNPKLSLICDDKVDDPDCDFLAAQLLPPTSICRACLLVYYRGKFYRGHTRIVTFCRVV